MVMSCLWNKGWGRLNSSLLKIVGWVIFHFFDFFQPQNHLHNNDPPHFMTFVPKVSKTFISLGKITKITPISLNNFDPHILWFFYRSVDRPCLFNLPTIKHRRENMVFFEQPLDKHSVQCWCSFVSFVLAEFRNLLPYHVAFFTWRLKRLYLHFDTL